MSADEISYDALVRACDTLGYPRAIAGAVYANPLHSTAGEVDPDIAQVVKLATGIMEYQAKVDAYNLRNSTEIARCALCGDSHKVCRFDKGLWCVLEECQNPHHRTRPDAS
jgi:hypothetical protein